MSQAPSTSNELVAPALYATNAEGLRFYEETALHYVRAGKRRSFQGSAATLFVFVGMAIAVVMLGPSWLVLATLLVLPILWTVSGFGQWHDGRQYLLKIEAQKHYRQRDVAESERLSQPKTEAPPQTLRAPVTTIDDDDDGKMF